MDLSVKHKAFADEYFRDKNGTAAYMKVYGSKNEKTAAVCASKLLRNANIIAYVESKQDKVAAKVEISKERIAQEYARLAFSDIRQYYNEDGALKDIVDLHEDAASALAGVEHSTYRVDDETTESTKKIKIWDKLRALDGLCKLFGYNEAEKQQIVATVTNNHTVTFHDYNE